MIQLRNTRVYKILMEALALGAVIQEEGVALAYVKENGETKVRPSTGAAGELFAGFAIARNMPPNTMPMVEEGVSKASGTLARAPIPGSVFVALDGTALEVITDPAVAPTADQVRIVGSSYALHASNVNKKLVAQYHYAPSVQEARTVIGDAPYGGLAANALGTVATLKQAEVATSFFDSSADWSNTLYAKLGAGGKLVPGDADDHAKGIVVKNSPSVGNPFLVLEINVG